jgi:hypothetical protein
LWTAEQHCLAEVVQVVAQEEEVVSVEDEEAEAPGRKQVEVAVPVEQEVAAVPAE